MVLIGGCVIGMPISLGRVDEVLTRVKHHQAGAAPNQSIGRLKVGRHCPERK